MQNKITPARQANYRMIGSVVQCAVWTLLSIHSWRSDPDGLYFWLFSVLLAISVFILLLDVVRRLRGWAASSEE